MTTWIYLTYKSKYHIVPKPKSIADKIMKGKKIEKDYYLGWIILICTTLFKIHICTFPLL